MNYIFEHPFTCMISGPTGSGKTHLLFKILQDYIKLIFPQPKTITYYYSRPQKLFQEMKEKIPEINFREGMPDLDTFNPDIENLIVLDDLMTSCENDREILNLFTVDSHHRNISVFLLNQNLFSKGKFSRTISLNCHYIILLNNPRDRSQIFHLARQMYPTNSKFLIESYDDATDKKYGYIFLDFKQASKYRVQAGILPQETRIVYQEKKQY